MSNLEFLPEYGSIILGSTDNEGIWKLQFRDEQSGEDVQILLPLEQLEGMDAEFTGLDYHF